MTTQEQRVTTTTKDAHSVAEVYAQWQESRFRSVPDDDAGLDALSLRVHALALATLNARPIASAADMARMLTVVEIEAGEAPDLLSKLNAAISEALSETEARPAI